jgi:hypothetical protein
VFIEHPPENSMASFDFTSIMLDEGTTFIFGSWICVTNGSGGFNSHLANTSKPEASSAARCSDLDEFVDNLLSIETHRRATTGNTRSREASGMAGGPRSLGQWPSDLAHTLA